MKKTAGITSEERVDLVEEARSHILEAVALLEHATKGTPYEKAIERQLIAHLRIIAGESEYLANDMNLDEVIALI